MRFNVRYFKSVLVSNVDFIGKTDEYIYTYIYIDFFNSQGYGIAQRAFSRSTAGCIFSSRSPGFSNLFHIFLPSTYLFSFFFVYIAIPL